jgi:D-amino-acid dehydrogenase
MIVPSHSVPLAEPGIIGQGLRYLLDPESPFYIKPRWDRDLWRWLWHFRKACRPERAHRAMPLLRDMHLEGCRLYAQFDRMLDRSGGQGSGLDGGNSGGGGKQGSAFSFGQRGRLLLCRTGQGLERVAAEGEAMSALGLQVEVLDAAGLNRIEPNVDLDCSGGLFYPQDAHLDPARFVAVLAGDLELRGVSLHPDCEVLGFTTSGSRVTSVQTNRGDFAATEVVIATGSWSAQVGALLGLNLPIQPAKGYSVTVEAPAQCPAVPLMLTEAKVALTPMGDSLRFAGTFELAGMDMTINRRRLEGMRRSVAEYVPAYAADRLQTREVWRGLRPCTPDGLPLMGRPTSYENLTVAVGHASVGMSLAPASGRITACIVNGEDPGVDVELLRADRFG